MSDHRLCRTESDVLRANISGFDAGRQCVVKTLGQIARQPSMTIEEMREIINHLALEPITLSD